MAGEKRIFTLIVIPESTSKTYSFQFSRSLFYLLGALFLFVAGSYVYMLGVHHKISSRASKAGHLERENAILRTQTQKITDLERELSQLQNIRQRLYEMAGVPSGSAEDVAGVGMVQSAEFLTGAGKYQLGLSPVSQISKAIAPGDSVLMLTTHKPTLWPVRGWVTAEFNEILPGREKRHTGLDIAAPLGTPILTAAAGKVTYSGWDKDLGLVAIIGHQNGLSTLYGHCSQVLVEVDDLVTQGQAIALVGNTGQSSAPHLHFEIREEGIVIDPREFLGP
jgi:murein DD-endopeptidase MepM/ murein hydrolase activator NlpD